MSTEQSRGEDRKELVFDRPACGPEPLAIGVSPRAAPARIVIAHHLEQRQRKIRDGLAVQIQFLFPAMLGHVARIQNESRLWKRLPDILQYEFQTVRMILPRAVGIGYMHEPPLLRLRGILPQGREREQERPSGGYSDEIPAG
jgi:hypothetical protein